MKLNDKVYDILKLVAQYLLPACSALYFALSRIWNLPYPEQIVGTIMALDAFLGVLLNVSSNNYKAEQEMNSRIEHVMQPELFALEEVSPEQPAFGAYMSKELYDTLYWVAQILLPAGGTLYFALAALWGFPYGEQIVATVAAVDAFLGVILGISNAQYKKAMSVKLA